MIKKKTLYDTLRFWETWFIFISAFFSSVLSRIKMLEVIKRYVNCSILFKEKNKKYIRIWYFRYEIFLSDISVRMVDFGRKFRRDASPSQKRRIRTKRSKRMRGVLVAVAYKYRDLLGEICIPKGCDSPSLPARATTFVPLSRLFHRHSLTLSFFSALRIIVFFFRFFLSTSLSLLFPLAVYIQRYLSAPAHPLLIRGECGINKAAPSGKTINPERRASNLLNGERKKAREREKGPQWKTGSSRRKSNVRKAKGGSRVAETGTFEILACNLREQALRNLSDK